MSRSLALRILLALAVLLLLAGLFAFALSGFERLIAVWERALAITPVLAGIYILILLAFVGVASMLLWWIFRPPRRRKTQVDIPTEKELTDRITHSRNQGLDVTDADYELEELARRRGAGELYIALYGQISAGKTSLVRALLPNARVETNVLGGTTRQLERHIWQSPSGDSVFVSDAPGINATNADDERMAREEALRAHLVVYVCEGDLTRDQWQALEKLLEFDKPLIVAINKIDRFSSTDLVKVQERISSRLANQPRVAVVAIQTGGEEEVIQQHTDGSEEPVIRPRAPQIDELINALQKQLESDPKVLASLRDTAVLKLASGKLDTALDAQRQTRADELVGIYTRRAIVGALAALTPGSDLVIQGALATQFVRELCKLYDAVPGDLQIEKLLKSANRKLRRNSAIVLAVAGNGLKAFPGAGTVTGGLMHAVAYGLLFDTLGRAAVHTLRTRGDFEPEPTAQLFESMLDEDLYPRARRLASLALKRNTSKS